MIVAQQTAEHCFACGSENTIGLKLNFFIDTEKYLIFSEFTLDNRYGGHNGIIHGGIISTIIDEAAVKTTLLENGIDHAKNICVTKSLLVNFIKPTPINKRLKVVGKIINVSKRHYYVEVELGMIEGPITAKGKAEIVVDPHNLILVRP